MNVQEHVNKLIEDIPKPDKTERLDVVLDGGAFNGSYLIGAMHFLMEMEKRNYVCIERISCSSIGSFVALAYHGKCLDFFSNDLYGILRNQFTKKYNLNAFQVAFNKLSEFLPKNIHKLMTNKVFIAYYNIVTGEKVIKSKFKSRKDVFETIRRSCSVPFIIDGSFAYKNKFVDGLNPFIFPSEKGKKVLYMDLMGYDKIGLVMNIKNEKNNYHRVFSGLLDIYTFFLKKSSTSMCSFVGEWTIIHTVHYSVKIMVELLVYYFLILMRPIVRFSYYSPPVLMIFKKLYIILVKEFWV